MKKNQHIAMLVILLLTSLIAIHFNSSRVTIIQVKKLERTVKGRFLVHCEKETFENVDSVLFWKFESRDIQRTLKPGQRYKVKVYWYSVPVLSWHRNILKVY